MNKVQYVSGFLFDMQMQQLVMIKKIKGPKHNIGKWTVPGGKIEEGEDMHDAIIREFKEETGLDVPAWKFFCGLSGPDWDVYFHLAQAHDDYVLKAKTMEEEQIQVFNMNYLPEKIASNIPWMFSILADPYIKFPVVVSYLS